MIASSNYGDQHRIMFIFIGPCSAYLLSLILIGDGQSGLSNQLIILCVAPAMRLELT